MRNETNPPKTLIRNAGGKEELNKDEPKPPEGHETWIGLCLEALHGSFGSFYEGDLNKARAELAALRELNETLAETARLAREMAGEFKADAEKWRAMKARGKPCVLLPPVKAEPRHFELEADDHE